MRRHLGMRGIRWLLLGLVVAGVTFWFFQIRTTTVRSAIVTAKPDEAPRDHQKPAMRAGTPREEDGNSRGPDSHEIKDGDSLPLPSAQPADQARANGAFDKTHRGETVGGGDRMLSAEEILQAMRESYARLSSYTDRGRQTRTWNDANKTYSEVPFRTFFKQPLLYRFELLGDHNPQRESFWSNPTGVFVKKPGEVAYRLSSLPRLFKPELIPAASEVLQFLAPGVVPSNGDFLASPVRLTDDVADGVSCYRLSGITTTRGFPRELWIGKDDFLIRRILTVTPYAYSSSSRATYFSGQETIRIDRTYVTTDLDLPDELFHPPRDAPPPGPRE